MSTQEKVLVDTPEAYQPSFITTGHPHFWSTEQLKTTLENHDRFNPGILEAEESVLGVQLESDPDTFLERHRALVDSYASSIEKIMPSIIENTVDAVATYMGRGDITAATQWRDRLMSRASGLSGVGAVDHLQMSDMGDMLPYTRSIKVNSIFALMDPAQAKSIVEDHILPHEVIHLISTSAVIEEGASTPFGAINQPVRTGVSTTHNVPAEGHGDSEHNEEVHHAAWINEAATEDLRSRALGNEEVGYTRGVALLRTLKECDHTLESTLDMTMLGEQGPGIAVAKIEDIIGPLGIDVIEPYVSEQVWDEATETKSLKYDDEAFVDKVLSLVPGDLKEKVEALLRQNIATTKPAPSLPPHLTSMH